jgi:hypothetical protein
MDPVHSTLAAEEDDPRYHTNSKCPHYHELLDNNHVAQGTGGYPECEWCKSPPA